MANSIIRTWGKTDFLNYPNKKTCLFIAKFFSKYLIKKNPSEITNFWNAIFNNTDNKKEYTFDRSYFSREENKLEDSILDLEIFEEWYSKIKDKKTQELKNEISNSPSKKNLLLDVLYPKDSFQSLLINHLIQTINDKVADDKKIKSKYHTAFTKIDVFFKEIEEKIEELKVFFQKHQFQELINTNHNVSESDLVQQSEIKLQETGFDFFSFVKEKASDISIFDENNEKEVAVLKKGNIVFDHNKFTPSRFYLKGESGNGKTFIALLISKYFLDNNYFPVFIKCDEETIEEKIKEIANIKDEDNKFIVFDDCHKLDFKKFKKIYNSNDFSSKYIILFTFSSDNIDENEFSSFFKNKPINKLKIKAVNHEKNWIKTYLDKVIYEKYKNTLKDEYEVYSEYLKDIIKEYSEEYITNTNYTELGFLLKTIAFKSLFGKVSFEEMLTNNDSLNEFIRKNNITFVSEKPEKIFFTHDRFRDILAVEYLLSDLNEIESTNFILQKENLKSNQWKYFLSYYSFRINKTNFEKLNKEKAIIIPLLEHLLSMRAFSQHQKILGLINFNNLDENSLKIYYLHYAKNYYNFEGNYKKSIDYSLKSYFLDKKTTSDFSSDILNQIMSCLVDLYLPTTGLKIFDLVISLENLEKKQEANILGNKARFFIKQGFFENAFKFLDMKYRIHLELNENNPIGFFEDVLRDKADIILSSALLSIEKPNIENYNKALEFFQEIKEEYEKLQKNNDLNYDRKLSFIYRNLSYFLNTNLSDEIKENLIIKLAEFNNLKKTDTSANAGYYINLGKYYYHKGNKEKAKELFSKPLSDLEKYSYKAELYVCHAYLFFITSNIEHKEKSLFFYNSLKSEALESLKMINDSLKLDEEGFSLKNIFEKEDPENHLKKLFLI